MSLKLACPRCQSVQFFDETLAGEAVTCAHCGQAFRVPRQAVTDELPRALTPSQPLPMPAQIQVREIPASFEPLEPLSAKVVPLADAERPSYRMRAREVPASDAIPSLSNAQRPMRRISVDESGRAPWTIGVSVVVFILVLFAGTAGWFLLRNDRQPQPNVNNWGFEKKQAPQQWQQQQPWQQGQIPMDQLPHAPAEAGKGAVAPVAPMGNEKFNTIKLTDGELHHKTRLDNTDASDPLRPQCRRKVFLVELKGKRNYTIEMRRDPPIQVGFNNLAMLDPYLRLEDSKGVVLDENDDIVQGFNQDSRIKIKIQAKGTYRIIATSFYINQTGSFLLYVHDDDMGQKVAVRQLKNLKAPQPVQLKQPLPTEAAVVDKLRVTTVLKSDVPLGEDLCWSREGTAFFALGSPVEARVPVLRGLGIVQNALPGGPPMADGASVLRRISFPGNEEEVRLDLGHGAANIAMSKWGLVAAMPGLNEVWLLDPDTLTLLRRISAPGVQRVTATPASALICASVRLPANPLPKEYIMVLDTVRGAALRQYEFPSGHLTMAPDGKHLFAESGIDQLARYRIEGGEIVLDAESGHIASQPQGVFVSLDGKYVSITSRVGNNAQAVNPPAPVFTTFIYAANDLTKPAFTIFTDESPRAVGFDPLAREIFASNNVKDFIRFDDKGNKLQEVNLPGADRPAGEPRQFLPHPDGRRILVRTETMVYSVQLP